MKVLFIGGTGIISSACSRVAVERGLDLYHLRRGKTARPIPEQIRLIEADIRDPASARAALAKHEFDSVVDFIAFTPEHIALDLELFRGKARQFVFISSASAYEKPPARVPLTEQTRLDNPHWAYSRAKIACESALLHAFEESDFPVTIVRPSHTYDPTLLPCHGGYTVIERMRSAKPIVVHGDGTSLWTLTHHQDFARAFVPLLGNPRAVGEAFHITSDEWLSWDQIHLLLGRAIGVEPKLVHVPSELIAAYDAEVGSGSARRQGAQHAVRQHQDQELRARLASRHSVRARRARDRRTLHGQRQKLLDRRRARRHDGPPRRARHEGATLGGSAA